MLTRLTMMENNLIDFLQARSLNNKRACFLFIKVLQGQANLFMFVCLLVLRSYGSATLALCVEEVPRCFCSSCHEGSQLLGKVEGDLYVFRS